MRMMQAPSPGATLTLTTRPQPEPGPGEIRVAVEACGVCNTDAALVRGVFGTDRFPVTPGHEVAGRVDAVGPGAAPWQIGDRVAIGAYGGSCGHCGPCRAGDLMSCTTYSLPGVSYPGGYADAIVVPASAAARIPDGLSAADAAPLSCAGVTVFNGLRTSRATPGDLVAVLGLGGLGHLAVQFASRMGFRTVAVARGESRRAAAAEFGAIAYVDSLAVDVAGALRDMGGATVVLSTVTAADAMNAALAGLARHGEFVALGGSGRPLEVATLDLVFKAISVRGRAAGTAAEIEETMRFALATGVRSRNEIVPLEAAAAAHERMLAGQARYRMVLTTT
jgi:alcohol dehydrogenase